MISRRVVRALIIVLSRLNLPDFRVKPLYARIFYNREMLFLPFFFFFFYWFLNETFCRDGFQLKIYLLCKILI